MPSLFPPDPPKGASSLTSEKLSGVLRTILKDRKFSDSWLDVADLVIAGMGDVVIMPREDYDELIKKMRATLR